MQKKTSAKEMINQQSEDMIPWKKVAAVIAAQNVKFAVL